MTELTILNTDDVLESLRLWHGGDVSHWPLAHLRLGAQLSQKQNIHSSFAESGLATQNRAILSFGLEHLRSASPESEELLRQRFEHRQDVIAVANSLNVAQSSLYYRQRQAISQLTEILIQLEEDASKDWQERMQARLDLPTYTELVGMEETQSKIVNALLNQDEHFIVSIDGLGGLGKTALAHKTSSDFIHSRRFEEIAWVTAKQTHLTSRGRLQVETGRPALTFPMLLDKLTTQFDLPESVKGTKLQKQRFVKQFLQERACLIVIDNLETIADYQDLIPEIKNLQNPSKFLITSRFRLIDHPGVFSYSLSELPRLSAYKLLRMEAERTGFFDLANAQDNDLSKIYDLVGGNPMALKLIVGQLRFHSLPRVLDRLAESQHNDSGIGLFDYIYYEAWETLNDDSKLILLTLTQAGDGGFTLQHIVSLTNLPEIKVESCIEELILISLVDQKGSLWERKYSLHRLTELFLLRVFDRE